MPPTIHEAAAKFEAEYGILTEGVRNPTRSTASDLANAGCGASQRLRFGGESDKEDSGTGVVR